MCQCPSGYECPECRPVPHKHAELIKAWADGAVIEERIRDFPANIQWATRASPQWLPSNTYRIKPEPKPDIVLYGGENNPLSSSSYADSGVIPSIFTSTPTRHDKIKYTYDGETGQLKNVELI